MKRIMVLGCCGAGKSTLSKKLAAQLQLPIIHLDQHYWKPNWVESEKAEWEKVVQELAAKENWIMDGNYGGTIGIRLQRADTIIYLDYSTATCFWRVLKRIFTHWHQVRPDMTEGCAERLNAEFLHYVLTYNIRKRASMLAKLKAVEKEKKILILQNDGAVSGFLENLQA